MAANAPTNDATDEMDSKTKRNVTEPSLNMDELRELADLIEERGITEFEFENETIRVRMSKVVPVIQPVQVPPVAAPASAPPATAVTESTAVTEDTAAVSDDGLFKITSPIVGTFYRAPGPDKDPFVKVGDTVSAESVVCIVEAMKLMNEIQAESSGEVVKIYVENAEPVEYGQPLFGIKQ
ncbi:MAG: acetyl-CoA carboxylase biotin carboxyl carrier protein [Pyrinomonadaceae bacterium]